MLTKIKRYLAIKVIRIAKEEELSKVGIDRRANKTSKTTSKEPDYDKREQQI